MNRRRRLYPSLALLAVFLGIPVWLTWRAARQERLDQALIMAVQKNDTNQVVALLGQGANVDARDTPRKRRSALDLIGLLLHGRRSQERFYPTALRVALNYTDGPRDRPLAAGKYDPDKGIARSWR